MSSPKNAYVGGYRQPTAWPVPDAAMDSCFALVRAHQHGDMAVRVREILARPWVGICVLLALKLS